MPSSRNSLTAIILLCLVIVGIAVVVRVNQIRPFSENNTTKIAPTFRPSQNLSSKLDPVFLEETAVQSQKKRSPVLMPSGVPDITATSYIVGNTKTGEIYLERNSRTVMPVASMSKLVTAFVATDIFDATSTIEITDQALLTPPDKSNLRAGEKFSLKEILDPLLLNSSNVAAEAISYSTDGRSDFLYLMKSYAWEIGMPSTFFADPSGVSPQNVASARDLFNLAKYLVNYRPDILVLTRTASSSVATTTDHGSHIFSSTHPFVRDSRFIGGKTGRTPEAGETMMTILNISNQPIAFIILNSNYGSREWDTKLLVNELLKKAI
ncbi:MAG: serine hydrolase [Patescibacteria group bacterium]